MRPSRRLAPGQPLGLRLDAVDDRVLDQVQKRVRDLLDDRVVHLDGISRHLESNRPPCRTRELADATRKPREQPPHRDHSRPRDLAPQPGGEALDVPGVLVDAPDGGGELGLDLAEVGGQLTDGPRQDVEVVVAVELERREQLGHRREAVAAGRARPGPGAGVVDGEPDVGIEVLALEVPDRSAHPAAAHTEEHVETLELAEAAVEAAARDHELADQVHEAVESPDVDADRRPGRPRRLRYADCRVRGVSRRLGDRWKPGLDVVRDDDGLAGLDRGRLVYRQCLVFPWRLDQQRRRQRLEAVLHHRAGVAARRVGSPEQGLHGVSRPVQRVHDGG